MKLYAVAAVIVAAIHPALAQSTNTPAVLANNAGRFVFGQVSELSRDKYMLDTQTGRLWQLVRESAKDDAGVLLQIVPYADNDGRLTVTPPPPPQAPK